MRADARKEQKPGFSTETGFLVSWRGQAPGDSAVQAEINARSAQIADRQLADAARKLAEVAGDPGLDVKHKLKVMIPILPVLLAYEGELELGSRLNLAEAWAALRGWVSGG